MITKFEDIEFEYDQLVRDFMDLHKISNHLFIEELKNIFYDREEIELEDLIFHVVEIQDSDIVLFLAPNKDFTKIVVDLDSYEFVERVPRDC